MLTCHVFILIHETCLEEIADDQPSNAIHLDRVHVHCDKFILTASVNIHICGGAHRAECSEASTNFADVSNLDCGCSPRIWCLPICLIGDVPIDLVLTLMPMWHMCRFRATSCQSK